MHLRFSYVILLITLAIAVLAVPALNVSKANNDVLDNTSNLSKAIINIR